MGKEFNKPGLNIRKADYYDGYETSQRIIQEQNERQNRMRKDDLLLKESLIDMGYNTGKELDLPDETGKEHAITGILGVWIPSFVGFSVRKNPDLRRITAHRLANLVGLVGIGNKTINEMATDSPQNN